MRFFPQDILLRITVAFYWICFRSLVVTVRTTSPLSIIPHRNCSSDTGCKNDSGQSGAEKKRGLSYYHKIGSDPLIMKTLGQILDDTANRQPQNDAIISHFENKKMTYQEVKDQVDQLGAGFLKLGLKRGDRIGILGINTTHWYISMLAAAKTGLISVFLNPAYQVPELEFALKNAKINGLVTDHKFRTQDYPGMLAKIIPEMSSAKHGQPISNDRLPDLSFVLVATEETLPGCYRLEDVKKLATSKKELHEVQERIQPEDPISILYSSGTTGIPKGAVISHFGVVNTSHISGKRTGVKGKNVTLCLQLPFFHIFGAIVGIFSAVDNGNKIVLPSPVFLKEPTIDVIQKYKCEALAGTPTMFIDLCNQINLMLPNTPMLQEACKNVTKIICGGAFVNPEIAKELMKVFPKAQVMLGYGMTEMSGVGTCCFPDDSIDKKTNTVGHLLDHTEMKVVDDDGKIVPFGTPGEAWFRSSYYMIEYWNDEKKTRETKNIDGWLKTGDIMTLDEDGYATVVGRKKDMIIRGGENIFPVEIEKFLIQHPAIMNAEVYGVTDKRMGEEVAVSIKLHESANLTEDDLKEFCKGKISHFKIPKYIRFVKEFPLTPIGKVKKHVLKERLEKELKEINVS